MSRPRDRMSSERRRAMDGPSPRAVGQADEPKAPDVSRANKWGRRPLVHFLKRAGLSKVTRPGPKGGRSRAIHNPQKLQSGRLRLMANRPYDCMAQPCLLATGTESGWTPGCHQQRGGVAAPIGPKTVPNP